jgi:hypothetical protein
VGAARTAALLGVYLLAFIASHVIADPVGTWPAVAIVAGVVAVSTWLVADAARRPGAPTPRTL